MNRRRIGMAVLGVFAALLALGGAWLAPRWTALSTFPRMPSTYEAKEMCSCRFVEHRDDAFCGRFVHQTVVPTQGRTVDESARRVTAKALWVTSSAHWVSDRDGCVIDP